MFLPALLMDILFIGHSLVGWSLPQMVDESIRARHDPPAIEAQIIVGSPLAYNWDHSANAEGVDARALLPTGRFDAVVMTEAVPLANHMAEGGSIRHATQFYQLAVSAAPDTRVFLYETWHSLDSGTGRPVEHDRNADIPWRQRLEDDLPRWQEVVDGVNASRAPGQHPMALIPAGQAMARLHDAIAAGTVPGLDSIHDLFHDDIHPNESGLYFVAMVHYAVLVGQSPVGLPYALNERYGLPIRGLAEQMTAPLATRLQEIAWEAVQAHAAGAADRAALPAVEATATVMADDATRPENPPLALGLAGVHDYAVQQPFLNVMKTAREWVGHMPGQWGGRDEDDLRAAGVFDENGWPRHVPEGLVSVATLVLTDMPEAAVSLAGSYRVRYRGQGDLRLEGRAQNVRRDADGALWFDYTPGGGGVQVAIAETDPERQGDHIRDITIIHEDHLEAFEAGALFNPRWLAHVAPVRVARFMDWMATNGSTQSHWDERPLPAHYSWARTGVPLEVMLAFANETGIDPWFTLPHLATDAYIRRFAEMVRDGLDPARKVYVELSNEVWNWQFAQAHWAEEAGRSRWGAGQTWVQAYALRAARMAQIWSAVFGDTAEDRLVRVIATQTGWYGLEDMVLRAPRWLRENPSRNPPPARFFDAYAITGYFSAGLGDPETADIVYGWIAESTALAEAAADAQGLAGAAREDWLAEHRFDHAVALAAQQLRDGSVTGDRRGTIAALIDEVFPYHAAVAASWGLDLVMYEGGSHVVGIGPVVEDETLTAFFTHLNYSPEMGALYAELLDGWRAAGGTLFNAFVDVYAPNKWGSWGALRHLDDDNPRWRALMAFNRGNPAWW